MQVHARIQKILSVGVQIPRGGLTENFNMAKINNLAIPGVGVGVGGGPDPLPPPPSPSGSAHEVHLYLILLTIHVYCASLDFSPHRGSCLSFNLAKINYTLCFKDLSHVELI